jgi:murein endopeptidase
MNLRRVIIAGVAFLAACTPAGPPLDPTISGMQAREFFGSEARGSADEPEVIGFYSNGCVAGAQALPETGPTWQAMRLSRNRNWGHPELIDYVTGLSRQVAATTSWSGLYIGDMSQPRGGPMTTGHVSHQSGLDVDIWMLPARDLSSESQDRESLSSISMQSQRGAWISENWTEDHAQVLRLAASDPGSLASSSPPGSRSGFAGTRPGTGATSTGSVPRTVTITISTCGSPVLPGRATVRSRSRPNRAMAAPRQKPAAKPF